MKKLLLLLFVTSACRTTLLLDKVEVQGIKYGSEKVIIESSAPVDSLFNRIAKDLSSRQWIVREARAAGMISCDPRMVKGNVYIKPLIKVSSTPTGSIASYSGVWSERKMEKDKVDYAITNTPNDVMPIRWEGYKTMPAIAFQNLIMMAKRVEPTKITYGN